MNIKRIIKEELNTNLLSEGIISDVTKKFNITEIKKLLKEKLDIDQNSTKLEIAKKLLKYYYKLELKLLKYELGALLGYFIFYILSAFLDAADVGPFKTDDDVPGIPHFILWAAGAILGIYKVHKKNK